MTNWKETYGDQKPEELDTTSSPKAVYERKNIEEITVGEGEEQKQGWKYQERIMSKDEYNASLTPSMEMVMQAINESESNMMMAMMMNSGGTE